MVLASLPVNTVATPLCFNWRWFQGYIGCLIGRLSNILARVVPCDPLAGFGLDASDNL